eukprot:m.135490 g.135490  ORF g.135490 m.135490 type:complete len:242 (-) comp52454_c0_seq1:512-1237(-)
MGAWWAVVGVAVALALCFVRLPGHTALTAEELRNFDGSDAATPVYVAILGDVFDVSTKRSTYGPGGSYSFFAGKDASAAFATGKFKDSFYTEELPAYDVSQLNPSQVSAIVGWNEFYHRTYTYVGCVVYPEGKGYYDAACTPLPTLTKVKSIATHYKENDLRKQEELATKFPTCNTKWAVDSGGELWCENELLPRLGQLPGEQRERCGCYSKEVAAEMSEQLRVYPKCDPASSWCKTYPKS